MYLNSEFSVTKKAELTKTVYQYKTCVHFSSTATVHFIISLSKTSSEQSILICIGQDSNDPNTLGKNSDLLINI